jgi:UDP-N-acetylglucosamine 2-epimerase (non-hydrolysing)
MTKKIAILIGTRPDAIKMAPVAMALESSPDFEPFIIATAQHRELLDRVVRLFGLRVNVDLDVMKESQDLFYITTEIMKKIKAILKKEEFDLLLVQGDTTTSFVAALSAFYEKIPIGHVEAGLRTYDKYQPFPEEINRVFIDDISDVLFPPTAWSEGNLLSSGIPKERIHVTGNTGIDALLWAVKNTEPSRRIRSLIPENKKLILLTCHRRESFGQPIQDIFEAVKEISKRTDVFVLYPVHPNPEVRLPAKRILGELRNMRLIEPVDYKTMAYLIAKSHVILTDSGGIQEEAPTFKVPVLILRRKTERPEGVEAGIARLVGTDREKIVTETSLLLDTPGEREKMQKKENPYGDGKASQRIVYAIKEFFLSRSR